MKLLKLLTFISIVTITANNSHASNFCFSHGQCQSLVDESTACYKVRLKNTDKNDNTVKCETRCFSVYAGSYCDFIPGKKYGTCKDEDYKQVDLNVKCEDAVPEEILSNL